MEHNAIVSAVIDLSTLAALMVIGVLLPAASLVRRVRNVFSCAKMDRQRFCRGIRWNGLLFQWTDAQFAHLAESYSHMELDAMGGAGGGKCLAQRRRQNLSRGYMWRAPNARRRPGNYFLYVAGVAGAMDPAIDKP